MAERLEEWAASLHFARDKTLLLDAAALIRSQDDWIQNLLKPVGAPQSASRPR